MPKTYNKLVRDLVPGIIQAEGHAATFQTLPEETFGIALADKLQETAREYFADPNENSLVDMLELTHAIATHKYGLSSETLEELRQQRRAERGGFEGRILLIETTE